MATLARLFQQDDGSAMADAITRIRARQKESKLASLLSGAYNAEGGNRQALLAQAIGVDPRVGLDAARMLDPQSAGGALGVQSTFVNDQGQRVAIMRDGSVKVLGGNDMGMSQQTISVEGPNGEPVQMTFDKRTGNYRPLSMGGSSALGSQPQPINIQYDGPEEDRAAFEQLVAADAQQPFAPGNYSAKLPQRDVALQQRAWTANTPNPYGNAMPGVGMSAADKAYAQEDAKQRAQLASAPQQAGAAATQAGLVTAAQQAAQVASAPAMATAKSRAEAAAAWPTVKSNAMLMVNTIDGLLKHPGRKSATGASLYNPGNFIPGQPGYDFKAKAKQIEGQAFLQAFNMLRGGGQITEVEGKKATDAMVALDQAQSEGQYEKALKDLRGIAVNAMKTHTEKMQGGSGQQSGKYRVGQVIEHGGKRYRVTGGDMNDPDVEEVR